MRWPDVLKRVGRITFELSNRCNMATAHKGCPLNEKLAGQSVHLPMRIAKGTLEELWGADWSGTVSFHNYSEPLLDPRLYHLCEFVHNRAPMVCGIYVMTNAWALDQTILDEFCSVGVSRWYASAYTPDEYDRLNALKAPAGSTLKVQGKSCLDDRLMWYERAPRQCKEPCDAPLGEVIVRVNGDVGLCCFEWAGKHTFGNLFRESIVGVLEKTIVEQVWRELKEGTRNLDVCTRCGVSRQEGPK